MFRLVSVGFLVVLMWGPAGIPLRADTDRVQRDFGPDRFAAGRRVTVSTPVSGDLIAAGGDVDVDADVDGDALVAGGTVRIRGKVGQSLYGAGGQVHVLGAIDGNARVAGGEIDIAPDAEIAGNISVGGGDVRVHGSVGGYVQAAGGQVYINGPVAGDVEARAGHIELGPDARILGTLRYTSEAEISRHASSTVEGGVERVAPAVDWERDTSFGWAAFWLGAVGLILVAAVLLALLPGFYSRISSTLQRRPGWSLLAGFIALILIPLAAFILIMTLIGIPLGLLTMLVFLILLPVGYVSAGIAFGDLALRRLKPAESARTSWRIAAAALAVFLLLLLGSIPVLGGLITFAALLFGIGALLLQFRRATPAVAHS